MVGLFGKFSIQARYRQGSQLSALNQDNILRDWGAGLSADRCICELWQEMC